MPRGYVCTCGVASRTPLCPNCSAERAERQAAADAERGAFYRSPFWLRLAAAVRERDGRRCIACREQASTVHHIEARDNAIAEPTTLDHEGNLVTLCASCHSTLEADRRAKHDAHGLISLTRLLAY